MDNIEYIDNYFEGVLSPEEKKAFEERLINDKPFAEDVAFYLSVQQASEAESASEQEMRFKELYRKDPPTVKRKPLKTFWKYAAAAVVIFVLASVFLLRSPTQERLAGRYIMENFATLGVSMSSNQEELQEGIQLFNEEKFREAVDKFKKVVDRDSANYLPKMYLGITYLRLNDYDKSLSYFKGLENNRLRANPAKFYAALALMKRNKAGDKEQAKRLLQQVVDQNLQGKETAARWLTEF